MELTQIDFAKCEEALYSQYIKDYIRSSVNDLGYDLVGDVQVSGVEEVRHKPYLFTSKEDHDEYELSYRVYPGEQIRFDNLVPSSKRNSLPLENPHFHHLTVGKMYTVVSCPQTRFGQNTWITIRNDIGDLVRHYRGRFTKLSFSGIEEPEDDDLL